MLAGNITWDLECQTSASVTRLSFVPKEKIYFPRKLRMGSRRAQKLCTGGRSVWSKVKGNVEAPFFPEVVCQSIDSL